MTTRSPTLSRSPRPKSEISMFSSSRGVMAMRAFLSMLAAPFLALTTSSSFMVALLYQKFFNLRSDGEGGLRSHLRRRQGRGRVGEPGGLEERLSFGERHGQGSVEGIAGRRRVHGNDLEGGHDFSLLPGGDIYALGAQRDQHRPHPFCQQHVGRFGQVRFIDERYP